jgi:hypothetical protein
MPVNFSKMHERAKLTEGDVLALQYIAQGYKAVGMEDRYIAVENPDYRPDNGSGPYLIINLWRVLGCDELDYVENSPRKRVQL